ncbi:MAG: tetratricopeptide repeat protein [Promethearchaeota archaeon]
MASSSKTFRVFICSTFEDMKEERNALQALTFPKLKTVCESHGYKFQPIDLRWGISEEASIDQRTVEICLEEIRRCKETKLRPYFLVLLGSRYGWIPLPYSIPEGDFLKIMKNISEDARKKIEYWYHRDTNLRPTHYILRKRHEKFIEYDKWVSEEKFIRNQIEKAIESHPDSKELTLKYSTSIVEHEISEAVFNGPSSKDYTVCFFREIIGLQEKKEFFPFIDINDEGEFDHKKKKQLINLKEKLKQHIPENISQYSSTWESGKVNYDYLKNFCDNVFSVLTEIIFKQIDKSKERNEFEKEIEFHETNIEFLSKNFIGRGDSINIILNYIDSNKNQPLIILGDDGVGKSALLARTAQILKEKEDVPKLITRFINLSSKSSNITDLLQGILYQLNSIFNTDADYNEGDFDRIRNIFQNTIDSIPKNELLILIIDGFNHLSDLEVYKWFKVIDRLPENIRVISSFKMKPELEDFFWKIPDTSIIELRSLTIEDGTQILDLWLEEEKRTLTEKQKLEILNKFLKSGLPLYLKLAFEHAMYWHSFTPMDEYTLQPDIPGLIESYYTLLTTRSFHGPILVQNALSYLAKSRNGLMEDELIELLSRNEDVMNEFRERNPLSPEVNELPLVVWSRLYFDLKPFLTEKLIGEIKTLHFSNIQLKKVVENIYCLEPGVEVIYDDLIGYFSSKPDFHIYENNFVPNSRKVYELPYLFETSRKWDELEELLTSYSFIASKSLAGMINDLIFDYNQILSAKYKLKDEAIFDVGEIDEKSTLIEYASFIKENSHYLRNYPNIIFQLTLTSQDSSIIFKNTQEFLSKNQFLDIYFKWLNKPAYKIPGSIVFTGHSLGLKCCSWSPDKKKIVTGDFTGTVKVWDPINALELNSYSLEVNLNFILLGGITSCCWAEDDEIIFSSARKIKRWNLNTNEVKTILKFVSDTIIDFSLSPDKKQICICFEKSGAELWDIDRKKIAVELDAMHNKEAWSCTWINGGSSIVVGYNSGEITIFNAVNGYCIHSLQPHYAPMVNCQWSPDGRYLASSSVAGDLKIWENDTFRLIQDIDCASMIIRIAWSHDGKYIAVATADDSAVIYELRSGRITARMRGHYKLCMALEYSPNDKFLLTASTDGTARIWHVQENMDFFEKMGQKINELSVSFVFFPDGKHFSKLSPNGLLAIYDLKTLKKVQDIDSPRFNVEQIDPKSFDFIVMHSVSNDCKFIATGSFKGKINIYNTHDGKLLRNISPQNGIINTLSWSPDNRLLLSCSEVGVLKVDDISNNYQQYRLALREIMDEKIGHPGFKSPPTCCEWAPNGKYIAIGHMDGSCSIIDAISAKIICQNHFHSNKIFTLAWSPDSSQILSSDINGGLKVWDRQTGQSISEYTTHHSGVYSVLWSPDGNYIIAGFEDGILMVWDVKTGLNNAIFPARGQISSIFPHKGGEELYLYDVSGCIYQLKINSLPLGIPIVTPVVFYDNRSQKWNETPSIRCKLCNELNSFTDLGFSDKELHTYKINCCYCNSELILNPFIVDDRERVYVHFTAEIKNIRSGKVLKDVKNKIFRKKKKSVDDELQVIKSPDGLKFTVLFETDPKKKESWYDRGVILSQNQRYDEAIEALQGALKIDPKYVSAWNSLGITYAIIGNHKNAEEAFRKVLEFEPKNSDAWYHLGTELYHLNNKEETEVALKTAVKYDSKNSDAWYNLGILYNEKGSLKDSEFAFTNALEAKPNDFKILSALGQNFAKQNRLEEAEKQFRKATEIAPDNADAWYELGISLNQLNRKKESEDAYRQSLKLDPTKSYTWNNLGLILEDNGNFDGAEDAYREALRCDPNSTYPWYNLGKLLKKLNRLDEAEQALRESIKRDANYTSPMEELGLLLITRNKLDEAEDIFENMVKINPRDGRSWGNLGYILEAQGRLKEAEVMYKKSLELDPEDNYSLVSLGAYYDNQDELEKAETYYNRALKVVPNDIILLNNMALLFEHTNRLQEAENTFLRALQINPSDLKLLKSVGFFYCRQNRFKEGEKCFLKMCDLNPSNAEAWGILGKVYKEQNQIEKAKEAFNEAMKLGPENSFVLNNIGWSYYEFKEYEKAEEILLKALKADPNNEYAWDSLGSVYEATGKFEEAIECYKKAIELKPTFQIPKDNLERLLKELNRN